MNIGIDATCWRNTRGYGRHIRALLRAVVALDRDNRYTFFTDAAEDVASLPPGADVQLLYAKRPTVVAASADGHRSFRDMWRMSRAMAKRDVDLLLFPTVYSFVPVWSRARKIVFIHDIIAEKYPHLTLPSRRARLFWKAKVNLGRRQADAIVTVSEYSRRCIADYFKTTPESIFVVGEASDPMFRVLDAPSPTPALQSLGLLPGRRSVIYVGGFGPHKNLETLVAVFARLASEPAFSDVRLVMVGEYEKETFHSYAGTLKQQLDALGLGDRVVFTGYLPDEDLVVLLNLATVLVLPSLMEGFGLPAVEAAACGCPVIATTASPLPELLDGGGLYVDPMDALALERTLRHVLQSDKLRRQMSEAGRAAAGALTWEAAARQLLDVFRRVAASQSARDVPSPADVSALSGSPDVAPEPSSHSTLPNHVQ